MPMPMPVAATQPPTCAICLDTILPDSPMDTLNCKHQFHHICFQPWLHQSASCPLCRTRVTSINGQALPLVARPVDTDAGGDYMGPITRPRLQDVDYWTIWANRYWRR